MLTQEQKDLLEPLTSHPKFGKLLIDAMKSWENQKPVTHTFGMTIESKTFEPVYDQCCLIGASVCKKEALTEDFEKEVANILNLSNSDMWDIIRGFDSFKREKSIDTEAYIFGRSVSKIVFSC